MTKVHVVFVGHGTRREQGIDEFNRFIVLAKRRIARELASRHSDGRHPGDIHLSFCHGFLEMAQPDLPSVLESCLADDGCVLLVPLFLLEARHMKVDIPGIVSSVLLSAMAGSPLPSGTASDLQAEELRKRVLLVPAVGRNSHFLRVLVEDIHRAHVDPHQDGVLLLGRGNRDADAQDAFQWICGEIATEMGLEHIIAGYLTGTGRSWTEALAQFEREGLKRVFIQPYLWFHGHLTEELPRRIDAWTMSRKYTSRSMTIDIGQPLGIHPLLVEAVSNQVLEHLASWKI